MEIVVGRPFAHPDETFLGQRFARELTSPSAVSICDGK